MMQVLLSELLDPASADVIARFRQSGTLLSSNLLHLIYLSTLHRETEKGLM
jgi:hypothetical protein